MIRIKYLPLLVLLCLLILSSALFSQPKVLPYLGGNIGLTKFNWKNDDANKIVNAGTGFILKPFINLPYQKFNFGLSVYWSYYPINSSIILSDIYRQFYWYELSEHVKDNIEPGGDGLNIKSSDIKMHFSNFNFIVGYQYNPFINFFLSVKYNNWIIDGDFFYLEYNIGRNRYGEIANLYFKRTERGMSYGGGIFGFIPFDVNHWYGFSSLSFLTGSLKCKNYGISETVFIDRAIRLTDLELRIGIGHRINEKNILNFVIKGQFLSEKVDRQTTNKIFLYDFDISYSYVLK